MTHKIIEDIKAAIDAAESTAEKAVAFISTLISGAQNALDAGDMDELNAILAAAKQTDQELAAAIASGQPAPAPAEPAPAEPAASAEA